MTTFPSARFFLIVVSVFAVTIGVRLLRIGHRSFGVLTSSNRSPYHVQPTTDLNRECMNRPHQTPATGIKFLFIVGLEGTGHHLFAKIVKKSPHMKRLYDLGARKALDDVKNLLYSDSGLMTQHCQDGSDAAKHRKQTGCRLFDTVCMHQKLVHKLRQISLLANGTRLSIPINANDRGQMMSYPNYIGSCRFLRFPVLDLFYNACSEAGVECGAIYLYRDPYSVIKSTTVNRHFNVGPLQAMHLYTTMLNIIYAQFATFDFDISGIFGFYESHSHEDIWGQMYDLFGWNDKQEFANFINETYVPLQPLSDEQKNMIVPEEKQVYMRAFQRAHENVIQLLRKLAAKRDCHQ